MKITREGINLVKKYEGLFLKAYKCPAGVWTIGYGRTSFDGMVVKAGVTITAKQAEDFLVKDLERYGEQVKKLVKVPLTDNQFSALVSFCYNVGSGALAKSSLLKAINSNRFDLVPSRLALWNKANVKGKSTILPGLVKRRAEEAQLFMKEVKAEVTPPRGTASNLDIEPAQGKPATQSSTNIAASVTAAAATTGVVKELSTNVKDTFTVFGLDGKILTLSLLVVTVLCAGYIIYERIQRSRKDGV